MLHFTFIAGGGGGGGGGERKRNNLKPLHAG